MPNAPRWRLTNPHYLNVAQLPDGTNVEWEHSETSRESGRKVRKLFSVPMFLDPKDPTVFNDGIDVVVAHSVPGCRNERNDYIFSSPPTQDMEPLNEEAEAISDDWRARWIDPINSMPANGGMTDAESVFMQKMMAAFEKIAAPRANVEAPASNEVADLKERLSKLEALLAAQAKAAAATEGRRV